MRCLRQASCRGQHHQSRAQAHAAALASQLGVDASHGERPGTPCSGVHPLSQGGEGHKGHLSTTGGGITPSRLVSGWEAATPHPEAATLLLLLLARLLLRHCGITSFVREMYY